MVAIAWTLFVQDGRTLEYYAQLNVVNAAVDGLAIQLRLRSHSIFRRKPPVLSFPRCGRTRSFQRILIRIPHSWRVSAVPDDHITLPLLYDILWMSDLGALEHLYWRVPAYHDICIVRIGVGVCFVVHYLCYGYAPTPCIAI